MLNDQDLQNTGKAEKTTSCTEEYDFTYLSLGAGVQSSALLLMLEKGLFGMDKYKVDVCFFADTQGEPYWVYDQLSKLKEQSSLPI